MSAAGFRGRGSAPRGRKVRGLPGGVIGVRNPQPNFNQPRRGGGHVPPVEFWLDHPPSVPWQQMNGLPPPPHAQQFSGFEPHRYRGRPQFCPGLGVRGRSKRIRGEGRPRPGILATSGFGGMGLVRSEPEPLRFPPLGSEEERQQKIAETADKLKQKLSSLSIGEPVNFWEDDLSGVSFSQDDEPVVANRGIPELRHDPPELNLTVKDFKDIGRVDPDCSLNSGDSAEVVETSSEIQGAEEADDEPKIWLESDHGNHYNCGDEVTESPKTAQNPVNDRTISRSDETAVETTAGEARMINSRENEPVVVEQLNYPPEYEGKDSTPKPDEEQFSGSVEKEATKVGEKKTSLEFKPELSKSLEKLREVIKVDQELQKEGKSSSIPEGRPVFQPNAGPRLQPDVRLDFHPGIPPGYPRFQGFGHSGVPFEMRNRFRGTFRGERPMDMQHNYRPEFQPRFDHRPDHGPRNFNLPPRPLNPRMMHPEFGGPNLPRMAHRNQDLQLGFDPREPPPRFNVPHRQDLQKNGPWFNRNDLPQKFGPSSSLNGLQPPPGFHPRGHPLRFINQDQELPLFGPNIIPPSPVAAEFPQIVPMGFPQVQHMHIPHHQGFFNPAMPPPNTAPCIIHKFPPHTVPPATSMESQSTLQLPPIPIRALDLQSHILRGPPSPPNLPPEINEHIQSQILRGPPSPPNLPPEINELQNPTPNMNDELEDMQEALEFAKKLMNMTDEEEDTPQSFDMPIFPDLPPIPCTESLQLNEILPQPQEPGNLPEPNAEKDGDLEALKDKQGVETAPPISVDESIKEADFLSNQKSEAQDELPMEDLARPKVAFNLNSRTKRIAQIDEWRYQNNDSSSSRNKSSKEKALTSSAYKIANVPVNLKEQTSKDTTLNSLTPKITNDEASSRDKMSRDKALNSPTLKIANTESSSKEKTPRNKVLNSPTSKTANAEASVKDRTTRDKALTSPTSKISTDEGSSKDRTTKDKALNSPTSKMTNAEGSSKEKTSRNKALNPPTSKSPSEDKCDGKIGENKNNKKNKTRQREDEKIRQPKDSQTSGENLSQKENRIDNAVEVISKNLEDNTKVRASSSKAVGKSLSASTVDANWKDKVINQFLKMSKNDICNMVNSSGLRKFDIAMKHLVKERKYSLSQERRCSADDAVKGGTYDMSREEFMSQLSAMLDPSATVDVKNLPSKFIQHLSEVLKLDVESHLNDAADPFEANNELDSFGNTDLIEDANNSFAICEPQSFDDPLSNSNVVGNCCTNETLGANVMTKIELTQEMQISADFSHLFTDMDNENNTLGETLPNMAVIDDIFTAGIAKAKQTQRTVPQQKVTNEKSQEIEGEFISHGLIRARCTRTLMSEENLNLNDVFSKNVESEGKVPSEKRSQFRIEDGEGWGRKQRQDPDLFRNLTKEEWEARCAKSTECHTEKEHITRSRTPSSRDTSLSARSHSPKNVDKGLQSHRSSRNLSPPTSLREKNCNLSIVVHTTNDAADKWAKAMEDEALVESDSDVAGSCSSVSSDVDQSASPKVTKLLKVIKQREKIAKDISLSETIRDEVTAEMEKAKAKDRESGINRKSRKREKNKRKKERREKKKMKRKKKTSLKIEDKARTHIVNDNVIQEAFIKQEELIIEADNEQFSETSNTLLAALDQVKEPNSHSTVDRNDETLSEISFLEHNEVLTHLDGTFNTREMLVAQEYATRLTVLESIPESSSHDLEQPFIDGSEKSAEGAQLGDSVPTENALEKLEARNTSNDATEIQLSKSGAKKIDIEAYKARKLQGNTGKQDKFKEIESRTDSPTVEPLNVPCINQRTQNTEIEIRKKNISGDSRPCSRDKCEQMNPEDNSESGSTKDSMLGERDSLTPPLTKEKRAALKTKSERKEEKRQLRKLSKEKLTKGKKKNEKEDSDEKLDKKRSRVHSKEIERSTSREDSRRTGKEKSKHSSHEKRHDSARNVLLDKSLVKATHQNNNIVELRDRKTTRHKACNSSNDTHERIEKHHSKSKKNLAEEKPGDKEAKKGSDCGDQSPALIPPKIVMDRRKEQGDDLVNVQNCDPQKEKTNVEQKYEEISTRVIETAKVLGENPETTSLEPKTSDQSGKSISNDMQTQSDVRVPSSESQNLSSGPNEETTTELTSKTTSPEDKFHVKELQEDAGKDFSAKDDDLVRNKVKDSSAPEEETLKLKVLNDLGNESASKFHQDETAAKSDSLELTEKSSSQEGEKSLEVSSDQNDIKTILNDLIDKAITQLDLLSGNNEVKETIVRREATKGLSISKENDGLSELGLPTARKNDIQEFIEYTAVELNSPQTPESPLKGFSAESIKSSILGKRRLAQSVLEITEDYMLNKRAKDFDNTVPDTVVVGTIVNASSDCRETIRDQNFEEINTGSRKLEMETPDGLGNDVTLKESEPKVAYQKDEIHTRCVTPSGDTLSLGSSIDFDNNEFIVLSEISSDEYFSQDENRKLGNTAMSKSYELAKLAHEQKRGKGESESEVISSIDNALINNASITSRESPSLTVPRNTSNRKLKTTPSKFKMDGKNSAKLSLTQDNAKLSAGKNSSQSPRLESNLRDDNTELNSDPAADVFRDGRKETVQQSGPLSAGANNLSKLVENEGSRVSLSCKIISKKTPAIDEDNSKRKTSKSDHAKTVNALTKEISSNEHNINKNLHRLRHRHKMKHKKEKRYKLSDKQMKEAVRNEDVVTVVKKQQTKEGVLARMVEIDLEIHKLMSEKMKLYQMLENGELPIEQSLESINTSQHQPDHHPTSNETSTSSAKTKSSCSKMGTESLHPKSSKITVGCTSEDDLGNRHSANHKDTLLKKSKKSHKHEKPSRPDTMVQTESRKSSIDKPVDMKSSISKKKNTDDKSTNKKENYSRSISSSNRRKEEETNVRKEEHGRKNVGLGKEALDEDVAKSKKIDHHSGPKKKANKVPESKDDSLRRMKKGQLNSVNNEIELRSGTVCESLTVAPEKHPPPIYSDESSQVSITPEYKVNKKAPRGLALLEETYKRERAVSRKRRAALCKQKKARLKSMQKSFEPLSPSDEEMPLNLLYLKKLQKKRDPLHNSKIKHATVTEVMEHIIEAINAVAENKTDEYHRSKKIQFETKQTDLNLNRKAKVVDKTKPGSDDVPNLAHTPATNTANDESRVVWPFEDIPVGQSLGENFSDDDFRNLDDFNDVENVAGSKSATTLHEPDDRLLIDKIVEISRENNGAEIVKNKSRIKRDVEHIPLFGNICGEEVDEIVEAQRGQNSRRQWSSDTMLELNLSESHTFNYLNDIPQFDDTDSTFMPQDPTSHSISRNFRDIEKGLDVLDSMLETVSSDLEEGVSSKDVPSIFVQKKGKRKRIVSGADGDRLSKKRNAITRLEMMNCSVRLVDCKYTHLKNDSNSNAGQKITTLTAEMTTDHPQPDVNSLPMQKAEKSHTQTTKSPKSPVFLQEAPSEEPLIALDENLPPVNYEHYITAENDFSLNHVEGNAEYDDDDLEIMKLHAFSHGSEDTIETLNKIQANDFALSGCDAQTTAMLDSQPMNSPPLSLGSPIMEISVLEEPAELGPCAEPPTKLTDMNVYQETDVGKVDDTKEGISASENSGLDGDQRAAAKCGDDVQVINAPCDQETTEIQEVELPRIQYSVHKGPILDVKVFGDSILAASEDGVIYRYSQTCNGILNTYEGHKSAVTCIHVLQGTASPGTTRDWLFSGSLDGSLRCFDIMTSHQVRGAADVGSPVQCMDQSWGVIFLGTKSGYVFRFHIKSHAFRGDEIKFSEESVLALKATTEGPRRVLIVASRSQPITIRDAQSGLFLRTVSGHKSHTVYSLMMDSNLVYCGTSSTAIPVFDFINGSQVKLYNAGPGIVCMRMYKWLLFAGCYDGNIYVFDTKEQRLVCSIPGPGNMLLSMDIVKNKIVAGSKDRRLHIWQMPEQVLTLLAGRT